MPIDQLGDLASARMTDETGRSPQPQRLARSEQRGVRRFFAGLALYRAIATDEASAALVSDNPLPMPVLALGGAEAWGRGEEPAEVLRSFAGHVEGGSISGAGHWLPEEVPDEVARQIRRFTENADD